MNRIEKLRCLIIDNTETALKQLKKGKEIKHADIKSITDLIYQYRDCIGIWNSTILFNGLQDQECICDNVEESNTQLKYGYLYNWYALMDYIPEFYPVNYGLLYNRYAATDVRLICAEGWEIPENSDYDTLSTFLGGNFLSGAELKETGTTYWYSPNSGATNSTKFNGRGSPYRNYSDGSFGEENTYLQMWCIDELSVPNISIRRVLSFNDTYLQSWTNPNVKDGISIRLIKTTTSLSNGEEGTYTGNDGKVYRTICIGTREWLADNLAETKYRNGDTIPEVTDDTAWAALETGALCAYNNDWNNV